MPETRIILFLGTSFAGLGASHYFLKHEYPRLPNDPDVAYKVVLVDPSSKFYPRTAAPGAAVRPDVIAAKDAFLDVEPGFRQYGEKVDFIQAKAIAWDDKARTVVIRHPNGAEETISYWALVLATGTKSSEPMLSLQGGSYEEVQAAHSKFQSRLADAKNIVIAGGGPSSVELAGELGDLLNGSAWFWQSRPSNPKAKIVIVTSSSKLLPVLRQSISETAERFLNRVGVDVRYGTKVSSASPSSNGKTKVTLHDGEELEPDIYIAATGMKPMSEYVPSHLTDDAGYVVQNNTTLRVDAAGTRVFAIGDIGTHSNNSAVCIQSAVPVLATNLLRDLVAAHRDPAAHATGRDREFVHDNRPTQAVPIGRSKGVGAAFGWRLPSFLVWLIKGRDYMVSKAPGTVDGSAVSKEVPWKEAA